MNGRGYSKFNRILASFLAICMLAMASLPYGNISYANSEPVSNQEGNNNEENNNEESNNIEENNEEENNEEGNNEEGNNEEGNNEEGNNIEGNNEEGNNEEGNNIEENNEEGNGEEINIPIIKGIKGVNGLMGAPKSPIYDYSPEVISTSIEIYSKLPDNTFILSNTGYAKKGDKVKITIITSESTAQPTVKLFSPDSESADGEVSEDEDDLSAAAAQGGSPWIIEEIIDNEDDIENFYYYIYDTYNDETISLNENGYASGITLDNTAPEDPDMPNIIYGDLGTDQATVNIRLTDNFEINRVYTSLYTGGSWDKDTATWVDITPNGLNGINTTNFDYVFKEVGTYKIKVTDRAGNSTVDGKTTSQISEITITNGDRLYMQKVVDAPLIFTQTEIATIVPTNGAIDKATLLSGGQLALGYTFSTCSHGTHDRICICEDGCDCTTDDECTIAGGCKKSVYECQLLDMSSNKIECEVETISETTRSVYLTHTDYPQLNYNYTITIIDDYVGPVFPEPGAPASSISVTIPNMEAIELTDLQYTWSTDPNSVGNEIYKTNFTDDDAFTYDHNSLGTTAWIVEDNTYKAPTIRAIGNTTTVTSEATVIINTGDTKGRVSFDWRTNTRVGHNFNVTINGVQVMDPVSGVSSKWTNFSRECNTVAGQIEIKFSYTVDNVLSATSKNPVLIQNLIFEGEKKWTALPASGVATLDDILGPDNYLYIKGETIGGITQIHRSPKPYKGEVELQKIEIHTVPTQTLYYYEDSGSQKLETGAGKITLIYDIGSELIDMSEGTISVQGTNSQYVDLSEVGVKEVTVSYGGCDAYFPIIVSHNRSESEDYKLDEPIEPQILSGMVPIKWYEGTEESYWITTVPWDTEWYDYVVEDNSVDYKNKNKWANVMLRDDLVIQEIDDLSKYKGNVAGYEALAGKRVLSEGSSFVWIPRFSYKFADSYEKIDVSWSSLDNSDNIVDNTSNGYIVHPAFTYGSNSLEGFWMAKYEASKGDQIYSQSSGFGKIATKPDMIPYYQKKAANNARYGEVSLSDAYELSIAMADDEDYYGVDFTNALSHLTKQAEWGAVAMLTYSDYGTTPYINNYAKGDELRTGYSGKGATSSPYTGDNVTNLPYYIYENGGTNASTTHNVYGVFDMSGGTAEYVASYVDGADAFDTSVFTDPNDVDVLDEDNLFAELREHDGWAIFDMFDEDEAEENEELWEDECGVETWSGSYIENDTPGAVYRGGAVDAAIASDFGDAGILVTYLSDGDGTWGFYGFRPTILLTGRQEIENVGLDISIKIKDSNRVWARQGDIVEVKIGANGAINVENFMFSQGADTTYKEMEYSNYSNEFTNWKFNYEVQEGDIGPLRFAFDWDDEDPSTNNTYTATTDGSYVKMDTIANTSNVDVTSGNGQANIEINPEDREDGESQIARIYVIDEDGNETDLASDGGNFNADQTGTYTIVVVDQAGNESRTEVVISSGILEGEINDVVPQLVDLDLYVKVNDEYVNFEDLNKNELDRKYVLNGEEVKIEMTFDQDLTIGPKIFIPENRRINATMVDENPRNWVAEFTMDSPNAYSDFMFEIGRYKYGSNMGPTFTEEDYYLFTESPYVATPYDGSNVNVEIGIPTIYQRQTTGDEWEVVESIDTSKYTKLEYVLTFSDITVGPDHLDLVDYVDTASIHFDTVDIRNDITIYDGLDADEILVRDGENGNQKILTFVNASGTGKFLFSIRGASVLEPNVVNPIAQDIYGHPNNKVTTTGNSAIWLTPDPSLINEYTVTYDAGEGENAPEAQIKTRNVDLELSSQIPTRIGYTFDHWQGYNSSHALVEYYPGDTYSVNESIVLTAVYTVNDYNVIVTIVDMNNSATLPATIGNVTGNKDSNQALINYNYGDSITLVATPINEYTFVRWESDIEGFTVPSGSVNNPILEFTMPAQEVRLKAKFVQYEVTGEVIDVDDDEADPDDVGSISNLGYHKAGTTVTLNATPATGYEFVSWVVLSDNVVLSSTVSTTTSFTMPTDDVDIRANFVKTSYSVELRVDPSTLAPTLTGAGTDYNYLDSVIIRTTNVTGYTFSGWTIISGEGVTLANASALNTSFSMPSNNVILQANYTVNTYNVTIQTYTDGVLSSAGGTTTGGDQTYAYGTTVPISATANTGFLFSNWELVSGGVVLASTSNLATTFVIGASDVVLKAYFTTNSYGISIANANDVSGSGTLNGAPVNYSNMGGGNFDYNTTVTLTAAERTGYTFSSWEVVSGIELTQEQLGNSTLTFTRPANEIVLNVNYSVNSYNVTINSSPVGGGSTTGAGSYQYLSTVLISATPATGYRFTGWTVVSGGVTINNGTNFSMPSNDVELTANFEEIGYTVEIRVDPSNLVPTLSGAGTSYNYGDTVNISTTVISGYTFNGWTIISGDGVVFADEAALITSFSMPSNNVVIQANYTVASYDLTIEVYTDGEASEFGGIAAGAGTYSYLATVPVSATANPGYSFSNWEVISGGVVLSNQNTASTSFVMPSNSVALRVYFTTNTNSVSIANATDVVASGVFGNEVVNYSNMGVGNFDYNSEVTLTAAERTGYIFSSWEAVSGIELSQEQRLAQTLSFIMPFENVTLNVNYTMDQYTVTTSTAPISGGLVEGAGNYSYGTTVTLNAVPVEGYKFVGWEVLSGGVVLSRPTNKLTTFEMPANNVSVKANFERKEYKVRLISNIPEAATLQGAGDYNFGATVNVEAIINDGYEFNNWTVISGEIDVGDLTTATLGFTMPANGVILQANFTALVYDVIYDANGGEGAPEAQQKHLGIDLTLAAGIPIRPEYRFMGWSSDPSALTVEYHPGDTYSLDEAVTLYAVWVSSQQYTLKLIDGDNVETSVMYLEGTSIEITVPSTHNTLNFSHWTANGIVLETLQLNVPNITITMPSNDVTLKANYSTLETIVYTVQYDANDGINAPDSQAKEYGVDLVLSSTQPTREGYTFVEWNTEEDGSGTSYDPGDTYTANASVVLYAQWDINSYTLTVENMYARIIEDKEYGEEITLTATSNVSHTFSRWVVTSGSLTLTESQQTNPVVTFAMPASNLTITASYAEMYTIVYDANGGRGEPGPGTKLQGVDFTLSNIAPTRVGYVFDGWNTVRDGTGVMYQPGDTYVDNANVTLYAQWTDIDSLNAISFTWDATGQLTKSITVKTTAATTIDWGDGVIENVAASPSSELTLSHTYASAGSYIARLKDDVVTHLECAGKQVTDMNVRNATALTTLASNSNQLTSLDVRNNTALTQLVCYGNQLTSLDVSHNTALTQLHCQANQLMRLDVSHNTALTYLSCYSNQLASLDISNNTALATLYCNNNQLMSLDVTNNTALTTLQCYSNQLTSLDVSNNIALTTLQCSQSTMNILVMDSRQSVTPNKHANTKVVTLTQTSHGTIKYDTGYKFNIVPDTGYLVTSLTAGGVDQPIARTYDFGSLAADTTLTATYGAGVIGIRWDTTDQLEKIIKVKTNGTTTIDWGDGSTDNIASSPDVELTLTHTYASAGNYTVRILDNVVTSLNCNSSQISSIDVSNAAALTSLDLGINNVSDLDVSHNTALTKLYCSNNQLTSLDVSRNTALTQLSCYSNQLTSLDVSHNTALTQLVCGYNQITNLDVSHNTQLEELQCQASQLTSLDISHNTALITLACHANQLTNLNVSNNVALEVISCGNNNLTSLDISHNIALRDLTCDHNALTSLDVSHNLELERLTCAVNPLGTLDVSHNTELKHLNCWNNNLSALDVSNNTKLTYLGCPTNNLSSLDVSHNTELTYLNCGGNSITSLDISHNTVLQELQCWSTPLTSLDVSNNLLLTSLTVENSNVAILVTDSRQNIATLTKASGTKVVTVTQTPYGRIEYAGGYKFNIIPDAGYAIASLTAGGVSQTVTGTYDFGSLSADKTLTATFTPIGVGSYVAYSAGGYTGDWVVLRNNTGQLEIISKESVGAVTLGGAEGYANAVSILNSKAKEYINYNYAVSARSVGSTVDSIEQIDTTQYPLTYEATNAVAGQLPYTDEYYLDDQTIIANNSALRHSSGQVFLASRYARTTDNSHTAFGMHLLKADATGNGGILYGAYMSGGTSSSDNTFGVRPVVTLRADLRVIGGSGTQADPYVLGIPHESVPVGSYISYTGGDYEGDWVVLRDTPVGLEIISKNSVGELTLEGANGYANAVATLNAKSQQYVNPSYAVAGRSVGATADSIGMIDTTQYPLTYAAARNQVLPYHDTCYTDDQTIIDSNSALQHNTTNTNNSGFVWMASRNLNLTTNAGSSWFDVRCLGVSANVDNHALFAAHSNSNTSVASWSRGIRPVITLRGNVKTTGGSGTQGNPYTLGF